MNNLHGSWEWRLAPGSARRLPAAPLARWLVVTHGRVWLTETGAGPEGGDVWLGAGQRHPLPAGSEWVAEGWPEARVQLLQAAPAGACLSARAGLPRAWQAPWQAWWRAA